MARTVEDVSRLMSVIARYDPRDSTMLDRPYDHQPSANISGLQVGVPEEYFGEGVDERVAENVRDAIGILEDLGATTVPVSIPGMRYALAAYYVICTSEASSNLARFDGVRYGPAVDTRKTWHEAYQDLRQANFGAEVRRRIMLGTLTLSAGYAGKYYARPWLPVRGSPGTSNGCSATSTSSPVRRRRPWPSAPARRSVPSVSQEPSRRPQTSPGSRRYQSRAEMWTASPWASR